MKNQGRAAMVWIAVAVLVPLWASAQDAPQKGGDTTSPEQTKHDRKCLFNFRPLTKDKAICPGDMVVTLGQSKKGAFTAYATGFRLEAKPIEVPKTGWVEFELLGVANQTSVCVLINNREVWKRTCDVEDKIASPAIEMSKEDRQAEQFNLVLRVGNPPVPVGGIQVFSVFEARPAEHPDGK